MAEVNDWALKVARVRGEYVWHTHPDTDEVFVIRDGALDIDVRPADVDAYTVHLEKDDTFVVPRGVDHRPRSSGGAVVYLIEPAATLSTGDYAGDVPDHITSTTGL